MEQKLMDVFSLTQIALACCAAMLVLSITHLMSRRSTFVITYAMWRGVRESLESVGIKPDVTEYMMFKQGENHHCEDEFLVIFQVSASHQETVSDIIKAVASNQKRKVTCIKAPKTKAYLAS